MYKKCNKCGKLFDPDVRVLKMVDTDGNELHIDLCSECNYECMVEDVVESEHIRREEAEKYISNGINNLMNKMVHNVQPYNNGDIITYDNWKTYCK